MGVSKYFIDEAELRRLHSEGLSNRAIAERLGVPHWKVARELAPLGLQTNALRGKPPRDLGGGLFECSKCLSAVPADDFPWVQGRADGRRLSYCRSCRASQLRVELGRDAERYWRDRQNRLRLNKRGLEYGMPDGHLYGLWVSQGGLCIYTGKKMVHEYGKGNRPECPSVDRVRQDRGYVAGNVVLCSNRANAIKRDMTLAEFREWMPGWHQRLVDAGFIS